MRKRLMTAVVGLALGGALTATPAMAAPVSGSETAATAPTPPTGNLIYTIGYPIKVVTQVVGQPKRVDQGTGVNATLSPDGSQVMFQSTIYRACDGLVTHPVTNTSHSSNCYHPLPRHGIFEASWSPDATTAIGHSAKRHDLVTMSLTNGVVSHLAYTGYGDLRDSPVWSPDGQWIAYATETTNPPGSPTTATDRVVIMHPDGSARHLILTTAVLTVTHLDWSPDSTRLAFNAYLRPTLTQMVGTIAIAQPGVVNTVTTFYHPDYPGLGGVAWSPDGQWIAEEEEVNDNQLMRVRAYRVDGSASQWLTAGYRFGWGSLDWAPVAP